VTHVSPPGTDDVGLVGNTTISSPSLTKSPFLVSENDLQHKPNRYVTGAAKKLEKYWILSLCSIGHGSLLLMLGVLRRIGQRGGRYDPSTVKRRERQRDETLSLWPRQAYGSGCSCPPSPTSLSHVMIGLRTIWHLEETTRSSAKILGGAGHHEHRALLLMLGVL